MSVAAIDTSAVFMSRAGAARYVRGLLRGLRALPQQRCHFEEVAWPVENFGYAQPARALRTAYRELIWARGPARRLLKIKGARLLHSPAGPLIHPPAGVANVVTVLDVAVLRFPGRFRRWQRNSARAKFRRLDQADRLIAISRFTADEMMAVLGIPASRVDVVHIGFDRLPEAELKELEVPAEFLLFVGSLEPGKNLNLLREVYALAAARGKSLPPLLIVGARWLGVPGEGAPPPGWHYLGFQDDGVLGSLYRRALAFLFPSRYEGFGIPLLEAMAAGCPVVASDIPVFREIAGEAALLVPLDAEAWLVAIGRLQDETGLRGDLRRAGTERTLRFSWQRCAEETLEVYAKFL